MNIHAGLHDDRGYRLITTRLTSDISNASTVYWQFKREHEPEASINLAVNSRGIIGNVIGNASSRSIDSIDVALDRTVNYYVRYRVNNGTWSDWNFINLSGELRTVVGKHRDQTTVTKTQRGATVTTSNPLWTETKTDQGAVVVNRIYDSQPPRPEL